MLFLILELTSTRPCSHSSTFFIPNKCGLTNALMSLSNLLNYDLRKYFFVFSLKNR